MSDLSLVVDARAGREIIGELASLARAFPGDARVKVTLATSLGPIYLELGPGVEREPFAEQVTSWFASEHPAVRLA